MREHHNSFPTPQTQRRARGFLTLFLILFGLWTLQAFIPALLWGSIFAIALWPLYQRAENKFGRSLWLPAVFTTILALIFLVPVSFIAYKTVDEVQEALKWLDTIKNTGIPIPNWVDHLPFSSHIHNWWQNNLAVPEKMDLLVHSVISNGMAMTKQAGIQLKEGLHRVILFGFSLLTTFFLLRDGASIIIKSLRGSQRVFGPQGEKLARQIISSVNGTLAGLVLVGLGEGLIMGIIYIFAGAPQPLIFGVATAIAAMIPVLGWVVLIIVCLLVIAKGSMFAAMSILILGAIVLFVADHFIRPALIGGSTKMPFLWVLLGIFGGLETWGLLGLFLGPAIMASIHLLWNHITGNPEKALSEQEM